MVINIKLCLDCHSPSTQVPFQQRNQSLCQPQAKKKKIGKKNKRHQTIYLVKLTRNCTQLKINNKKQ